MAGGPPTPDEPASELIDRWHSHRGPTAGPAPGPAVVPPIAPRHVRDTTPSAMPDAMPDADPRVDYVRAGRDVVAALGLARNVEPAEPLSEVPSDPPGPVRRRAVAAAPTLGASTDVDFAPRLLVRRVVGALTLVSLVATGVAAYLTYDERTPVHLGVAGGLAVLTMVLWAIRATSPPAHLSIHSGQLEVRRGASRVVVDLRSSYTPIELVGRPGSPGWKVLLGRADGPPFVVDASMVDAERFTTELRRFRPTL